jgi:hypothetical protein
VCCPCSWPTMYEWTSYGDYCPCANDYFAEPAAPARRRSSLGPTNGSRNCGLIRRPGKGPRVFSGRDRVRLQPRSGLGRETGAECDSYAIDGTVSSQMRGHVRIRCEAEGVPFEDPTSDEFSGDRSRTLSVADILRMPW